MALGDLADALALAAVALDSGTIQLQRIAADMLAFEPCAPHAVAHPLDDQVAFELGDGADDDHDGPAQRAADVDVFPEAGELDLETVELVENIEEVFHRPGDPI
jgi:F420-0:gamma-glutamyl ligase-like protein